MPITSQSSDFTAIIIGPEQVEVHEVVTVEQVSLAEQGPKGEKGDTGDTGGALRYEQLVPSATWVIVHNLGLYPNVTVEDSAGNEHMPDLSYDTDNQITLQFVSAMGGVAYLS